MKTLTVLFTALVGLAFLTVWKSGYGLALNPSSSMPRGLYLLKRPERLSPGSVFAVCIPDRDAAKLYVDRGYIPASPRCPTGAAPVLKPIVAGPGDNVILDQAGVTINGRFMDSSAIHEFDSDGQPIPHFGFGAMKLVNQYFVLSTHADRSLDSRYFGLIRDTDILGQVKPIVTE